MEYKSENKICQNCKKDFTIESEDFNFYEKIKVPPPTFCPKCRMQRRLAWRNERTLYKRKCDLCNKNIIAMYNESVSFPVYCNECWWGDGWDAKDYARDYDFNQSFFEQYKKFIDVVPRLALWQRNMVDSDYTNACGESKNVYLSYSVVAGSENVFYSKNIDKSGDIVDCLNIKEGQNLYENIEGEKNYNCQYLLLSKNCIDSYFLVDCVNCSDCVLSHNLRNKKFYIRNRQYSKEDYFNELEKLNLKSRASREVLLEEFIKIKQSAIYRFANIVRSINSTGNNLLNVKNCHNCFDIYNAENLKYCHRAFASFKDSMDVSYAMVSELIYEYTTGCLNDYNVKFSYSAINSVRNADYTECCRNCTNIFGCISLNNVENAIFNKVYSEEEYKILRTRIIEQMSSMPFIDKAGRIYKYGEFFPIEISPWAYNETLAQEFFPLTKEEAEKKGYAWREPQDKNFNITMPAHEIPDDLNNVNKSILDEVLGCIHEEKCSHQCTSAFRLTDYELRFYEKHHIPIPILCSNCRYYERFSQVPPLKLYHRQCTCNLSNHGHEAQCQNEFETPYAPERPEKVYCENCYNQEIY